MYNFEKMVLQTSRRAKNSRKNAILNWKNCTFLEENKMK